jgi:hypothetical protein
MPIFKFPGAIQLSSTTITTTLSTTPVSSPTLPTFFPDSHLPPAPIAPTDFSSPLSSSSSSQSLTQLSPKNSHPSPDSFPPTGSRTLECQHSRRWGSSHHEKELGSGGRAAHVQKLLCNNNKPVLHNNIMLACLLGLACGPSLLSTHLCDQIFSQNLITTHLRKKHQKSSWHGWWCPLPQLLTIQISHTNTHTHTHTHACTYKIKSLGFYGLSVGSFGRQTSHFGTYFYILMYWVLGVLEDGNSILGT